MRLPDFTASASLGRSRRTYYGKYQGASEGPDASSRIMLSQVEDIDNNEDTGMANQFGAGEELGFEQPDILEEAGGIEEGETDMLEETEAEDEEASEATGEE